MELIIGVLYLVIVLDIQNKFQASSDILRVFELVYLMPIDQKFTLVIASVWLLKVFDKWLTSLAAVSQGVTLSEF